MIKEALQYLVGLKPVQTFNVKGEEYSTEPLHRIPKVYDPSPMTEGIGISTLTGLVDYITNGVDNLLRTLVIHVKSPTKVLVYSELRADMKRNHYLECNAMTPDIKFERFMDLEAFNIMMQACFLENADRAAVLRLVGNVKEDNVRTTGDNGVAQVVTAKAGIANVGEVVVPNPVTLCPFRTFPEVEQPESKFVFRMKQGPSAALFEADGGKWKIYAMQNIKGYLADALGNLTDAPGNFKVKIIS